jgi:hypothetical protein
VHLLVYQRGEVSPDAERELHLSTVPLANNFSRKL